MKRKLIIVLFLTTLLLTGIIAVQAYWSFSAYKLNKKKFDSDINTAMQQALDSCKKDYFDSIRVVMIKRLSDKGTHIKVDTIRGRDTAHLALQISIKNNYTDIGEPYSTTIPIYNYYQEKINHKATAPEVLTEMSFYVPYLRDKLLLLLGMEDALKDIKHKQTVKSGTFELPKSYRQADSVKLHNYFSAALQKTHRYAYFDLKISDKPLPAKSQDPHLVDQLRYSETEQFTYKYHGFLYLLHTEKDTLFVRAVFDRAQVGLLKEMIIALLASGFLIVFTIFCLFYIILTIIKQKKLTELKDDFINNMTHELKTPIATITVAIEGLQKYNALNDPEKTQRYLQTSRNELTRLDNLVSKVLNIAAFENKEIRLTKEQIPVDELVNDLIASEKIKADKEINISYSNKDSIRDIEADKLHFRNVLANIIDNAVKYSEEPVDIKISLTRSGKNAVFFIKDNGIGISAAHIRHIFDKFHRVPSGNVHNVKGTGLGLNYVKYIVQAHGGSISVKSQPGAGSEFIITLPLKNG
ncbi:HAMP domain-containing sensor histidine kinase [Mucilaginibacter sp.]|jgi:signal transduction histidine kinase|uniref:sensor histidine kinase n=1 Tax=Mucilaginibacter sp. TaxID=1882438 RepID=UPI00260F2E34|nr:HAMP domain-containing sensor histidine kinase [Mucilaginibacter sp.]MDB5127143.1 sensor histidine kinase [Mucilaginibacter sp.]